MTAPQVLSSYRIVRTGGTGPAVTYDGIAANATSWVSSGLEQHTAYSYSVQPVNSLGVTPVYGTASVISATTYYAPVSLGTLTAQSLSPTNVTLSWTDGVPALNYRIYRCVITSLNSNCTIGATWTRRDTPAPASGFADNTVSAGVSYRYRVYADNGTVANTTRQNSSLPLDVTVTTSTN